MIVHGLFEPIKMFGFHLKHLTLIACGPLLITARLFDYNNSPTVSPSSVPSFSPTETCNLECKTDDGKKSSFWHLVLCFDQFTSLTRLFLTFDQTVQASV